MDLPAQPDAPPQSSTSAESAGICAAYDPYRRCTEPAGADRLELGHSQVIDLGEEVAVVMGESHTRMPGPPLQLRGFDTRGREKSDSGVSRVMLMPTSA